MQYRPLGRTGLLVSEICFGTMTFGDNDGLWANIGTLGIDDAVEQLKMSFDAGLNFIDTANIYHQGRTEEIIGEALRKTGVQRDCYVLATKVRGRMSADPNGVGLTRHHILNEIDNSLRRLGHDHVDLYQIHGFDPATPFDETLRALDDVVRSGKVRHIGLCNLAAWQIMKCLAISDMSGWTRFESIQPYYSVAGRDIEREIVPLAEDQGLAVLPWSPLAGGLLSGKFARDGEGPEGSRRATFDFPPVDHERAFDCVDAMRPIAAAHDCSVARVALAWQLTRSFVTSVIIGARTTEQLADNLAAAELELTDEEVQMIDAVSALPEEYPQWMIERQSQDRFGGQPR